MLAGLLGGVAISMMFFANTVGDEASFAVTTRSIVFVLADANTSAGAPETICVANAELAAKLKFTVVPGFAASNAFPMVVNDSFSEDAAKTVIEPLAALEVLAEPDALAELDDEALDADALDELLDVLELPQAASEMATTAVPAANRGTRRMSCSFVYAGMTGIGSSGFAESRWTGWSTSRRQSPERLARVRVRQRLPDSSARQNGAGQPEYPPGPSRCRERLG